MVDSGDVPGDGDKSSAENSKKRKLKTPIQVMALEKIYNEHKYPSEEMKAKLADEVELTEKQVSGWFCHRRLKDKRSGKEDGNTIGSQDRSSVVLQDRGSGLRQDSCGSTKQTEYGNPKLKEVESQRLYGGSYTGNDDGEEDSTSSERSSSLHKNLVSSKDGVRDMESSRYVDVIQHPQVMKSYGYKKPSGYLKLKGETENVAITAVKRQLGRQYREDGPPLGIAFDPLPPGAFEPQTNVIVQEPIYVGNQRRSHPPYITGTKKSFNPGSSPSLSYSNPVSGHKSLKKTFKGSPREIPLTNIKKGRISSNIRAEGSRNNLIANFHNLSESNIETKHTHDYDKNIFNGGRKSGHLTESTKLLPLSSTRSSDSFERRPSSGMAGKYHEERNHMKMHREKLHLTDEPPVTKQVKHGYLQQVYAPRSPNSLVWNFPLVSVGTKQKNPALLWIKLRYERKIRHFRFVDMVKPV
ncbi:unnamed protein product [Thlaspi arvense]|uniref:Homeobox domain-containing protein n=1 Tax=Thlaspi arvense TaxID=13288 RepID=A0AAU9SVY2_THLAR|nr:unnamed protein product [Thlaspi arvense]